MPESLHTPESAERVIRQQMAAVDRLRRSRDASRHLWRIAPGLAAAALAIAVLARWTRVTPAVPAAVLIAGAAALAVYWLVRRRGRPVTDAIATAIDRDAGMRGELRSANWFAAREQRDAWAEHHLGTAAARLSGIDWTALYPSPRSTRAQVATGLLVIATMAMALMRPQTVGTAAPAAGTPAPAAAPGETAIPGRLLDPELQKALEALLAAAAAGKLPSAAALVNDVETRAMLDRLSQLSDAELLDALKRALANTPDATAASTAANLKKLAEQSKAAAEAGKLPKELQEALEKLSDEMEIAQAEDGETDEEASAAASGDSKAKMSDGAGKGDSDELSIQFAKAAEPGGGAGMMMMSGQETAPPGGPPGAGFGGAGSDGSVGATGEIEAALTHETVEANQDTAGKNVETEIRRKTEHGNANVTFTGSASGSFDRTRAAAPPPVPESRRTGVQTYFVRKPK